MKTIGVVRRIDELGRIVIPKEIRRTLKIKDGESLEIFLEDGNIILKKYSHFGELRDFYDKFVDSISISIDKTVLITDRCNVIAGAGTLKNNYVTFDISSDVDRIIDKRTNTFSYVKTSFSIVKDRIDIIGYVVCPIIVDGDAIGSIIIVSNSCNLDSFDERTAIVYSKFFSKYIEIWFLLWYNFSQMWWRKVRIIFEIVESLWFGENKYFKLFGMIFGTDILSAEMR